MEKKFLLSRVRYHWYLYVARGGFNIPSATGRLEKGGIEHWTLFVQTGRRYADLYKTNWYDFAKFLPNGMIMLLTGESRHEFNRRNTLGKLARAKFAGSRSGVVHQFPVKKDRIRTQVRRKLRMRAARG